MIPTATRAARESGIALSIKGFIIRKYINARFNARHLEKRFYRLPIGAILPIDGNDSGS
jgi:hypothetical protein